MKILEHTPSTLTCKNHEFPASTLVWGGSLLTLLVVFWFYILFAYSSQFNTIWVILLIALLVSLGIIGIVGALIWRASSTHLHTFDKAQGKLLSIHKNPMGVQFSELDLDQIRRVILRVRDAREGLVFFMVKGVIANILIELHGGISRMEAGMKPSDSAKENRLNLTSSLQSYGSIDRAEEPRALAEAIADFLDVPLEVEQKS
jgi:hypothetical protein